MDYSNLYKKVKDSIVNIIQVDSNRSVVSTATGSIIGHGCDVLTCSHCIDLSLSNAIYDKSTNLVKCGTVIFDDEKLDIAILHFKDPIGTPLKIVKSDNLEIGNEIFTVGYPYTFPSEKTLTTGNIAAFENGLIKIDSSVNNGNSGGPLFNTNGEIVGVINAKLGRLSDFLEQIEKAKPQAFMQIGGIDPVQTIQEMLRQMQRNLNLGIGYAVPTSRISSASTIVKNLMESN
ncbi:MAG: trypsin-like peptidase domain-containing protein [Ruminococcaceae bacterium]|nr:trypsin-like peptidase domain-containing protein [Oscillospiraceae bacterium]